MIGKCVRCGCSLFLSSDSAKFIHQSYFLCNSCDTTYLNLELDLIIRAHFKKIWASPFFQFRLFNP